MSIAPIPENEADRLRSLAQLDVVDTVAEERFDRLTRLARSHFHVPCALVSLVGSDRQWHKSDSTMAPEVAREHSFCAHNILSEGEMVVLNAENDPRVSDSELVTGPEHVRFYAGVPLHGPDGHRVGAFCVIDESPRQFSNEDVRWLKDLAACAETELHLRQMSEASYELLAEMDELVRRASVDTLTRAWNRVSILELLEKELERARRKHEPLGLLMLDVDHFKDVNDTYGHPVGDAVLREVATRIRQQLRAYDSVGRYGGEEFLILTPDCAEEAARNLAERVLAGLRQDKVVSGELELAVTASIGMAVSVGGSVPAKELVQRADDALYRAKRAGRNRVES